MWSCCTSSFHCSCFTLVVTQPPGLVTLGWNSLPSWTELDKTGHLQSSKPSLQDPPVERGARSTGKLTRLVCILLGFVHLLFQLPEGIFLGPQQHGYLLHPEPQREIWSPHPVKNKPNIWDVLLVRTGPLKGFYCCWCFSVAILSSSCTLKRLDLSSSSSTALTKAFFCEGKRYLN